MKHLKLYEELSPYVKLLFNLEPEIHIYFSTELKMVAREGCRLFLDHLKKVGLNFLLTDIANPFFIISTGAKAKEVWLSIPVNDEAFFNGIALKNLTWESFRDPDQDTSLTFQMWDITHDEWEIRGFTYDLFIIDGAICRASNVVYRPS